MIYREGPGPLGTVLGHIFMQSQHRAGCLKWNVLQKPRRHGLWLLSDLVKTGMLLSKRLSSFQTSLYLMFFQSHVKDSLGETGWGSRLHHRDQMS